MRLDATRTAPMVGSGRGRLARYPGVVVYVADDAGRPAAAALLELCARVATDGAPQPGALLVQRVPGLLARARPGEVPSFCIAGQSDGGSVALLVHGAVEVTVGDGQGSTVLATRESGTWITKVLDAPRYITASAMGQPPGPLEELVDLQRGVVQADGMVVVEAGAVPSAPADRAAAQPAAHPATPAATPSAAVGPQPARAPSPLPPPPPPSPAPPPVAPVAPVAASPQPAPSPEPAPEPQVKVFSLAELAEPDDMPGPLPVASAPAQPAPDEHRHDEHAHGGAAPAVSGPPGKVTVQGIYCARNHFNDPRARYCAVCGIGMLQASHVLLDGERPPLGVLLFDRGETFPLDRDLVVGRDPSEEPSVVAGTAVGLQLQDPELSLSRVHAEVRLVGWDVRVTDRGSTNGTFVWDKGLNQWNRLTPDLPWVLKPGDQLAFGRRTAVFESSLNQ